MTIAAIATPNASGGVGIVRISGKDSAKILDSLFYGKPVSQMESRKMYLGNVGINGEVLDKALVCMFRAPASYTGEDTAEIHCHGGITVCRAVLDAAISLGARPALPGEFTKRAFLNGKMDLSQAEAVADLINAETRKQVTVAASQLDKSLGGEISALRGKILDAAGHLLATMDFSEEGVEPLEYDGLLEILKSAKEKTDRLILSSESGRIIKDGVNTAIIGAPNAGKSSLLNAILGEDRAIVTDIKGTTRDVLETSVNIRGCKLNLFDTAGIRESDDKIEKMGIDRSLKTLKNADLILFVADGAKGITEEEQEIISMLDKGKTVLVINKTDLPQKELDTGGFSHTVYVSAKNSHGLDKLYEIIEEKYNVTDIKEKEVITNPRHRECLLRANSLINGAISEITGGIPFDIVLSGIELAISALGEISGETVNEEIVDNIFSKFCVGK